MTKSLKQRDLEALSAFLDGQLPQKDTRELEARIENEAELRQALEDLRRTRQVLHMAPQIRRPRSFTLTPEMVGKKFFIPRGFTALRLVSVVASVLFVFVFAGDVFLNISADEEVAFAPLAKEAPMESFAVLVEVEAVEEGFMDKVEEPQVPGAVSTEVQQERAIEVEQVVEEPASEEPEMAAAPDETAGEEPPVGIGIAERENDFLATTPLPSTTPTVTVEVVIAEDADLGMAEVVITVPSTALAVEETPTPEKVERGLAVQVPTVRIVEGILVLVAVVSGGIAFLVRRKAS